MRTEYIVKHKTKTRIYTTKYSVGGFKKSMTWKTRREYDRMD